MTPQAPATTLGASTAVGCLSDPGSVFFSATSRITMRLSGTARCTQHDSLTVGQTLGLDGGTLEVRLLDGYQPTGGERFDLFDWGSLEGEFTTLVLPELRPGLSWDTNTLYVSGEVLVSGELLTAQAVPIEDGALVALGIAMVWAAWRRFGALA